MTEQDFINQIAPICVKYAQKYGFKVVSPTIAQACLESGYGTSSKAKHHNYFGMKYRVGRLTVNSGTFVDESQEQKTDGSFYAITDQWYNFDSMDTGIEGFYQFINIPLYSKVKEATTPLAYLQEIKNAGYATALTYVQSTYNIITKYKLTKYDNFSKGGNSMSSNSTLVDCIVKSPNHSGTRTHTVDRITPHCVVGNIPAEEIGGCFVSPSRGASSNYGIGNDGRVCLIVDEANRSWCSSSPDNDQRAITIECASDKVEPYTFNDAVYNKLVSLCVDICQRYGKKKLLWIDNKDKALTYNPTADEMVLTVHRWFANTACPGTWMMGKMADLASKVTAKLGGSSSPVIPQPASAVIYRVQVGAYSVKANADVQLAKVKAAGFTDAFVTQVNGLYKVQVGAYNVKTNADSQLARIKAKGFDAFITTIGGTQVSSEPTISVPYMIQVTTDILNYRTGPGTNYSIAGTIRDRGCYTISEVSGGWGKLKSGAGWIDLNYTKKI